MIKETDYRLGNNGYMVHRLYPERYMHRDVWSDANGPIPNDHHIHHKNKDRADNRIENLECMEKHAHMRLHGITFGIINSWASRKARKEARPVDCWVCDKAFWTHHVRAKYCSPECRKKYLNWLSSISRGLEREEKLQVITCPECQEAFQQKNIRRVYCSKPCMVVSTNRIHHARRASANAIKKQEKLTNV
jgi:hypothetical protein